LSVECARRSIRKYSKEEEGPSPFGDLSQFESSEETSQGVCRSGIIPSPKAQERQHLQNVGETQVSEIAEESKVETFETLEIFQVRKKLKAQEEERQQPLDNLQRKGSRALNLTSRHPEEGTGEY
jgi:hypothetical protein